MHTATTKVIVCADDYAQSEAIDAAILALIEQGVLTATSCMTLSPRWPRAAEALTATIRSKADIGLHLDFTQFAQALRVSHPLLMMRSLLRALPQSAIVANIRQQLDAFEEAVGSPPDYVDGHLHVHQLPQIRQALLAELHRRYGDWPEAQRPWLRVSSPPDGSGLKARIIHWLGARALQREAVAAGFAVSRLLLGVYDFQGDARSYRAHWQRWVSQLRQYAAPEAGQLPPVLMCHPAQPEGALDAYDPIAAARVVEWQVMQSPAFQQWLAGAGVRPVKATLLKGQY